jgi:hypothetical protein
LSLNRLIIQHELVEKTIIPSLKGENVIPV